MKIEWMGHACFAMTTDNGTRIVTDPFDETVGYPMPWGKADIVTVSHGHFDHNHYAPLNPAKVVDQSGEYAIGDVKIRGIDSFHDDVQGAKRGKNVIFVIEADGKRIVHLGDLGHMLSDAQLAAVGTVDAVLVPVGGTYTLTAQQAAEQMRAMQTEAIVPMHYSNEWCKFDITPITPFLHQMNLPFEEMEEFIPGEEFAPVVVLSLAEQK
jgi:L-ascorbate metabolism protein UlaG (beta-lactamase superfamily)